MTDRKHNYDVDMFAIFADFYPIEAYDLDKQMFIDYMKNKGYKLSVQEIEILINESREDQ